MKNSKLSFLVFLLLGFMFCFSNFVRADYQIEGCIASWDFDEPDGNIAFDGSGNGYNAELKNGASRSDDGALSLDGIDDYAETPFILNPANGPFSAFVWVKREGTLESLICQADGDGIGRTWLYVSEDGTLSTSLGGNELISDVYLKPNVWKQVGFVWDGEKRYLYVDGVLVGSDSQETVAMQSSNGGLYIGAYKELESEFYWQGNIDEVCIYDRALAASEIRNMSIKPGIMGWTETYMPEGSEAKPYLIQNMEDFERFASNSVFWDAGVHVKLECNIDLNGYEFDNSVIAPNYLVSGIINQQEPVEYVYYNGVFNGNGHEISNMSIINTNTYVGDPWSNISYIPSIGLFSDLGENAIVKNLFINTSEITSYSGDIGILAGVSSGRIENCHVTDSMLLNYGESVGGLVGVSYGTITKSSSKDVYIISYVNDIDAISTSYYEGTGGLVGVVRGPDSGIGRVRYSFATGEIYGINKVGGLVGYSSLGDFSDCYSQCDVAGDEDVGGFIGYMQYGEINRCYSIGKVFTSETSNTGYSGVLCSFYGGGVADESALRNNLWDREATDNIDYPYWELNFLPKGLTTSEMYNRSSYAELGWEFEPLTDRIYWVEQADDYPILSWEVDLNYDTVPVVDVVEGESGTAKLTLISPVSNNWEISGFVNCSWIKSVIPESGSITGFGQATINIEVDSSGLGVGGYCCEMLCSSNTGAEFVIPVILNVNERVDLGEFAKMANCWLEHEDSPDKSYRNVDWNWDGVLNIGDLAILAENWLGQYDYISSDLLLNWNFDTEQSCLALDSSGNNFNGILRNGPEWSDGSWMSFDGENDYITSEFILNPADGPFSVFAWIRGGDYNNVIVSQVDGVGTGRAWLYKDQYGRLASELGNRYLATGILLDYGKWNLVGLVWDGSRRHLIIDGIEVGRDGNTMSNLETCNGNMYFGAYKNLDKKHFWDGQIDDIRIYRHAFTADELHNIIALRTDGAEMFAHYKFDTLENQISQDSVGNNDGTVFGDVHTVSGVDGEAASFDGDGDYVEIPLVYNPAANDIFGVFAWVKGGGVNRCILSQKNGSNYDEQNGTGIGRALLYISSDGKLGTSLEAENWSHLQSSTEWDAENWHHVGLVWDGSRRVLYIDGIVTASDTGSIGSIKQCDGNLLIGAYKSLESVNFWNGEIDDVRIYKEFLTAQEIADLASKNN